MRVLCLIPLLTLGGPVLADQQMIPHGASLTAPQVGHAFSHGCFASQPSFVAEQAELFQTAFRFDAEGEGYRSADGHITVTVDDGALDATCDLAVAAEAGLDGAEIRDALVAHFPRGADEATETGIDGGTRWVWDRNDVSFELTFTDTDGAQTISFKAER